MLACMHHAELAPGHARDPSTTTPHLWALLQHLHSSGMEWGSERKNSLGIGDPCQLHHAAGVMDC